MIEYVTSFEFNSQLGVFLYWIPLAICAAVYPMRLVTEYKNDILACEGEYYQPTVTIGSIVGYIFVSVVPVVNLFASVFDCSSSVFVWLGKVFNKPLVPKRVKHEPR